jgi:GPH family glycoside/pentoside/hexuronide:cation symporter
MTARHAKSGKVSLWEIAAFAAPAAPLLALTLPTIIFLPPHYASHLGLPLGVVSIIFLAARVLDFIIDPFVGGLQDRTQTRWGRRRVWLAATCPPLMLLIWVTFLGLPHGADAWLVGAAVMAMYAVYAATMVGHLGWAGELVPTYHGRTRVLGAVQLASMMGQTLMLVLAAIVVQGFGGDDADAVAAMGWTLIVMLPVTIGLTMLFVREDDVPPQPHLGFAGAVRTVIENRTVRRVLAPDLLLGIAQGTSGGLFLFYFQFVLGFEREAQTLLAIYFIAGLLGVPIWWWLGRRFGKHRALQIAFTYTALTTALLFVMPHGAFNVVGPFMALAGLGQGGGVLLTRSLMADVVDEDELKTGARRSGVYFGLLLTTSKLGLATGPLAYAVLGLVGFDASAGASNTPEALATLSGLFIGVPIVLCLAGAFSLRNYPLDERRQAELAAAISARHARNSENT